MAWAPGSPLLAVGTIKGNLQLHHVVERRRVPILGKHTKRIAAVAWGCDRTLALASLDKTVREAAHARAPPRSLPLHGCYVPHQYRRRPSCATPSLLSHRCR